jgi:hypothetical protein
MSSPPAKKTVAVLLLAIILLALGLQVFNVGHVLSARPEREAGLLGGEAERARRRR